MMTEPLRIARMPDALPFPAAAAIVSPHKQTRALFRAPN